MCKMEKLPFIKEKILGQVKMAAQHADIEAIAKWSRAAEQCEVFILSNVELENQVMDFANSLWPEQGNTSTNQEKKFVSYQRPTTKREISPKRAGAMARGRWVEGLSSRGITLNGHDKRYYTEGGASVSIAFANELDKPQLLNKWFLGLKDEPTDIAVLLCQDKEGNMYDFILPVNKMRSAWEALSRSGGQVKFHIHRKRGEFLLSVPGAGPAVLTNYLSNYQFVGEITA
ncbi:MAG: hypothetical protein WCD80_07340 [Desulfobaccales bacterium]